MEVEFDKVKIKEEDMFSDPYENFCRLKRTVTFLTNGGKVTEDWMEEHTKYILKYREVFPNLRQTNPEVEDRKFRKTAEEGEVLLSNLIQNIQVNRFFNVKFYLTFNQHMITLTEYLFTEEELEFCMSKLGI